ncbi:MAG: LysM peptidoglycan-binding domain-containing protein [Candidatus Brocadiales bacterium]|nr:LysM peptidoglycan-binding domain-containing protein [Candidatus Brocadiales bacterium]
MKRDKQFVIFIVFIAFAVTGVLHYMRSAKTEGILPYLTAIESNLNVFGNGKTNEFYSFNSHVKPGIEDNIIPIGYFVEEQLIIEEFNNEKQAKPILCRDESSDYISFYISLTNDMNVYGNAHELKMEEAKSYNTIFSAPHQSVRIVSNNRRITHEIMANDSLYKLAKRYYNDGTKWKTIYQANRNIMPDPHSLKIGQEILIPNIAASRKEDRNKIVKT